MLQVRAGNTSAFEKLVQRHQRRVRMDLEHLTGSAHQAEDLSQEVFLRVFRSRKTYTPTAKFSTWLFVIVRNVANNAKRTRARRHEVTLPDNRAEDPLDQLAPSSNHSQLPAAQLEMAETCTMVRQAVQQLCERQRLAVSLQFFEFMKYEEIAENMSASPQAVKSLLARARVSLRNHLEPYMAAE
jgi:RNA polymerase sigma-70 factor (ECF subfamily)